MEYGVSPPWECCPWRKSCSSLGLLLPILWDFSTRQHELSFPAASAWHGWLDPFQRSSGVSLEASFHPTVKIPFPATFDPEHPKKPGGICRECSIDGCVTPQGYSPGGGQTPCVSRFSQPSTRHLGHPTAPHQKPPLSMRLLEHPLGQGTGPGC